MMLDELPVLDALGKTPIITHSTIAAVREFVDRARDDMRSEGSMGANQEGPVLIVATPERKRAALEAAEKALKAIEEKCRVVGCPGLADVDPADRKTFEEGIGASALESAIVGATAARIFWTDDGVAAQVVQFKFGTKRVWTQAVVRWLNEQGLLATDRYATISARLLGWRYMFTGVNPEVMRSAGSLAEWRPERWPLKQTLDYLSIEAVASQDAAFLSARLVAHCYLETVLPETRRVLVQAVAESLAKRTDAERTVPLLEMLLKRVFGLNVAAQYDAVQTFEAWRREHLRRLARSRA